MAKTACGVFLCKYAKNNNEEGNNVSILNFVCSRFGSSETIATQNTLTGALVLTAVAIEGAATWNLQACD